MPGMPSPPRLARWLLQWALTGPTRSAIVGDIEEEFARHVAPRLESAIRAALVLAPDPAVDCRLCPRSGCAGRRTRDA